MQTTKQEILADIKHLLKTASIDQRFAIYMAKDVEEAMKELEQPLLARGFRIERKMHALIIHFP